VTVKGNSRSRLLKEQWNIYLEPEQAKRLRALAQQRAIPMQVLMRDGINRILGHADGEVVTGDSIPGQGDPSLPLAPEERSALASLAGALGVSAGTLLGEAVRTLLAKQTEEAQRRARLAERQRCAEEYRSWSQALLAEQFNACTETLDYFYGPSVLKSPRRCEVRYRGSNSGSSGFKGILGDRRNFSGCMIARYDLGDGNFEYRNIGSGHRAIERFRQRHESRDEHQRRMAEQRTDEPPGNGTQNTAWSPRSGAEAPRMMLA
jgi:hypothetical protein